MRNVVGQAVVGADLYGRQAEVQALWDGLGAGEHIHMLAPRRVGKTSLMLQLRHQPRPNWHVAYVDTQGAAGPRDCVAAVIGELASERSYRTWLEAVPLGKSVGDLWRKWRSGEISSPFLQVELRAALGSGWGDAMDRLQGRLGALPGADARLLIILDELPVLVGRMLRQDGGRVEVELLLAKLRAWRQSPALRGKVQLLVGGSVGLDGMLRRAGLSALINDLVAFRVQPWDRTTATAFLEELGRDGGFRLGGERAAQMLDLLGDPVPYHLQLFFRELRQQVAGDASAVTAKHVADCFQHRLTGAGGTPHLDHYGTRLETALDEESYAAALAILELACEDGGTTAADIESLSVGREAAFRAVLGELEFDGYLDRRNGQVSFRSNLLRTWWRKHRLGVEA